MRSIKASLFALMVAGSVFFIARADAKTTSVAELYPDLVGDYLAAAPTDIGTYVYADNDWTQDAGLLYNTLTNMAGMGWFYSSYRESSLWSSIARIKPTGMTGSFGPQSRSQPTGGKPRIVSGSTLGVLVYGGSAGLSLSPDVPHLPGNIGSIPLGFSGSSVISADYNVKYLYIHAHSLPDTSSTLWMFGVTLALLISFCRHRHPGKLNEHG